jgi:hypothetical protein
MLLYEFYSSIHQKNNSSTHQLIKKIIHQLIKKHIFIVASPTAKMLYHVVVLPHIDCQKT